MHPRNVFSLTDRGIHWAAAKASLFLCLLLSALILNALPAFGANESPRRGEADPVSPNRRALFKDSEGFVIRHHQWQKDWYSGPVIHPMTPKVTWRYQDDDTVTYAIDQWYWFSEAWAGPSINKDDWRPVAAASGRVVSHKHDAVVHAYFNNDNNVTVVVLTRDQNTLAMTQVASITLSGNYPGTRSLDLAVGDLDNEASKITDENGNDIYVFYDEIVVANTLWWGPSGDRGVQVGVLKLVHHPDGTYTLERLGDNFTGRYGNNSEFVAVAIGDLWNPNLNLTPGSGDKEAPLKNEFAVAVSGAGQGNTNTQVLWFEIDTEDPKNPKLVQLPGTIIGLPCLGLDMTAGDFNGDSQDELCVVHGKKPVWYSLLRVHLRDGGPAMVEENYGYVGNPDVARALEGEIRVVSGLFKLDPANGFGFNKKQIMVAYASGDGTKPFIDFENQVRISILQPTVDSNGVMNGITELNSFWHYPMTDGDGRKAAVRHIDLAAGNFIGHGADDKKEATSPTEQAMLSYQLWWYIELRPAQFDDPYATLHILASVDPQGKAQIDSVPSWIMYKKDKSDFERKKYNFRMAVAAPDWDGDTYFLGTPSHASVQAFRTLDYYIEEPPKHLDYLPKKSSDWSPGADNWQVVNVSAEDSFKTVLTTEQGDSVATSTTQTSGWDIGQSADFKFEAGFNIGVASGSVSSDTRLSWDQQGEKSYYNQYYSAKTVRHANECNNDDLVVYRYMQLDIWRFPVFGYDTGDDAKPLGCYELVFPSGVNTEFTQARTLTDWFHPAHTNRNALSYPEAEHFGHSFPDPSDIGAYSLTDSKHTNELISGKCLNDPTERTYVGTNAFSWSIAWQDSQDTSATREVQQSTSTSETVTVSASGTFEVASVSTEASYSFSSSNSWSKSTNRESTHTSQTTIEVTTSDMPLPIDNDQGYLIASAAYFDATGALNLRHGAHLQGNFWDFYKQHPDPGLNLFNRFSKQDGEWILNTGPDRMEAREIFLRSNKITEATQTYDYLSMSLEDGDKVRVCARIHNYSLKDIPKGTEFKVQFGYVPIKSESVGITEMNASRTKIGDAIVSGMDARGSIEVYVVWDTTGLSSKHAYTDDAGNEKTANYYRIYVVMDPDDVVKNEIHEWKDPDNAGVEGWTDAQGRLYHGNNEGYWPNYDNYIAVHAPSVPGEPRVPAEVSLHDKSLAIKVGDQMLDGDSIVVPMGQTYPLRVSVRNSGPVYRYRDVLLRESHPDAAEELIGHRIMFGANQGDAYIWGRWTPRAPGEYDLHAQVLEHSDDAVPGNALDALHVTVTDGSSPGGGGDSSGCFINTLMP